jgi:predicted PurR-regulated permease PerM
MHPVMDKPAAPAPAEPALNRSIKVMAAIILAAIIALAFIELLHRVHTIATIVIAAIFLCYIIYPAVQRLHRRLPYWASLLVVYVVLIAIVVTALGFIVPAIARNAHQIVVDAPVLVQNAKAALENPDDPASRLPPQIKTIIANIPSETSTVLSRWGGEIASRLLAVMASVFGIVAMFIVVPIVALYILLDRDSMYNGLVSIIPPTQRSKALKTLREISGVISGFARGQLLVAIIVGALITIMLSALHVRYAFLIGAIAGLLEIIPYLGAFVGAVPAVIIALITNGWVNASLVIAGFVVINQLEGHIISPLVVGESVGLSPLIIIVALLAGGELFGLPGLLLAVPVAGIIKVVLANYVPRYHA